MISIITPAFNAGKYISETIESVISQTYSDWELLVIDDCSKDQTCNIVNKYTSDDKRIHKYFLGI